MNFNRRKSNENYIYIRNTEPLISISETPNHNTMKITLSESREGMTSDTYTKVDDSQPAFINDILKVEGVKSIFHVMDFISVDKENDANWETVLPKVEAVFE
ncbi:TPA: NifU N-terminal domain-containing protein [Staphylococcus aureus]